MPIGRAVTHAAQRITISMAGNHVFDRADFPVPVTMIDFV